MLGKPNIEQLTKSIDGYSDYLQKSCKKVLLNQSLSSPTREISDHLSFQFLTVNMLTPRPAELNNLHGCLENLPEFEFVSVEEFSPGDPKKKYQYLQTLKTKGFPFPSALLTYSHGNNVGNLNFIWRVPSTSETSFSDSQSIIESVKKKIPIYHTRAMRKSFASLFGRLSTPVKPAVLRHVYRTITGVSGC